MITSQTILLLFAVGGLSACTSWQVQSASPEQVLAEHRPAQVQVTRADSTTLVLNQPHIVGDTLYGIGQSRGSNAEHAEQSAVALADVGRVAIRNGDLIKLSSRLRIHTAGGRQEGRLLFRTEDSLGIRGVSGRETRLPLLAVDSMWVRGHRTGLGLLIGTAVGAAGYLVLTSAAKDTESETAALDNAIGGVLWASSAMVGTIVGALSSHWKRVHPK